MCNRFMSICDQWQNNETNMTFSDLDLWICVTKVQVHQGYALVNIHTIELDKKILKVVLYKPMYNQMASRLDWPCLKDFDF